MLYYVLVLGAGLILYKMSSFGVVEEQVNQLVSRSKAEPMSIDTFRAFGDALPRSGHPDKLLGLVTRDANVSEVREQYAESMVVGNKRVLIDQNFNNEIDRRVKQKGPSDDVHWPTFSFGSGWYPKATADTKKSLYTGTGAFRT